MITFDNSLPVTSKIAALSGINGGISVIILQHILPDTRQFVRILKAAGFHVPLIVAKPNSIHAETMAGLASDGVRVECHPYAELERTDVLDRLVEEAALAAAMEGRRLVAIDVGGYFRTALSRLDERLRGLVIGTVEVTTFGHNRYVESLPDLKVPAMSLARSPLKCAEAHVVGDAAVTAADMILRRCGVLIQGRRAGVIGFGYIGEAIAEALKARGLSVSIHDRDPKKLLKASLRGYGIAVEKRQLLGDCDIVFSATGSRAVDYADLADARDGLTLVSAGSKANEFDIETLKRLSTKGRRHDEAVQEYVTGFGRRVRTLCDGKAVNFHIQSCPEEVMDVVFAEQLACCLHLASAPRALGVLHELPDDLHRDIACLWLGHYKRGGQHASDGFDTMPLAERHEPATADFLPFPLVPRVEPGLVFAA